MIALTQEHITFASGVLGIIISVAAIRSWSDKRNETNIKSLLDKIDNSNKDLLNKIDQKLDKAIYERDRMSFREWSDERDRVLDEKISRMEKKLNDDVKEIKDSLKEINKHMLNCNKK